MRITIDLDEDVLRTLRELALDRGDTIDAVTSMLLRQALDQPVPVFAVPEDAASVTPGMVRAALEDG